MYPPQEAYDDPMYFMKRCEQHIKEWYGPVDVDSPAGRVLTEMNAGSTEATVHLMRAGKFNPFVSSMCTKGMLEAAYNMGRQSVIGSQLAWKVAIEPPTIHEPILPIQEPTIHVLLDQLDVPKLHDLMEVLTELTKLDRDPNPEPPAILPEPEKENEDMIWTNLDGEPFIDEPPDPTTGPENDDDASGWGESNQESE